MKKFFGPLFFCLFSIPLVMNAQTNARQKDTVATANPSYDKAGGFKRLFLGQHYRKEWATPVRMKILNLDSAGGGLTAIKAGGGHQTKSLRFHGEDGKEYVLRSVNKDPTKALPPQFVGTFAADIVQDQISSSNPYAALAVASLAQTAGIYHSTPQIVFVPPSPRLDTFINDFANTVCLFEERPTDNEQGDREFGNSKNIINSEKLSEKLYSDNNAHVDQRSFLKARLFDLWIGDWDRHQDQWVWAEFNEGGKTIYKPIPRDRDQAFAKLDGILPSLASKPWAIRVTKNFDDRVRDVPGLAMSATVMDHFFLNELTLADWLAVAGELKQSLTDEKIEEAFTFLPSNIYALHGKEVIEKLKRRRDELDETARDYYEFLAKTVSIGGTMLKEIFDVTRMNGDSTNVVIHKADKKGGETGVIYHRTFLNNETKEIRLYGFGGDDKFNITGDDGGILIRIISGNGNDSVIDNSKANGGKTKLYDKNETTFSSGEVKRYITQDTLKTEFTPLSFKYNWFAPKISIGYNPDDGVYLGGGIIMKKQQFGKAPWGSMQSIWGNYAFATGAYNFWYEGIFREAVGKWDLHLDAKINAPNYVLNYYGQGNETVKIDSLHDYYRVRINQWIVAPSLQRQFGEHNTFGFGLDYESIKVERSDNRYVTDSAYRKDSSIFDRRSFGSAMMNYQFNTTDNPLYPRRGVKFNAAAEFIQNVDETDRNFGRLSSDFSFFLSAGSLTAAFRFGGATNLGDKYEFYQANTLGGTTNLRGYGRTRFAGKSSFYQNTELRFKLQNLQGYFFRGNWGLLGFVDNGRVWIPEEASDTWHFGYGGGIWFLPYNKLAFAATYGASKEDSFIYLKADFLF